MSNKPKFFPSDKMFGRNDVFTLVSAHWDSNEEIWDCIYEAFSGGAIIFRETIGDHTFPMSRNCDNK